MAFSLPLLVLFTFIELNLRHVPITFEKKVQIQNGRISTAEILVMGSSHSYYGIKPRYFAKPGLSLAEVSQSLILDSQLLEKYLGQGHKVRLLIIPVSYFSLFDRIDRDGDISESWRNYLYSYFLGLPGDWINNNFLYTHLRKLDPRNYSAVFLYGPDTIRASMMKGFKGSLADPNLKDDGADTEDRGPGPRTTARSRIQLHDRAMKPENLPSTKEALHKMLDMATRKGIQPVILTTPVSKDYYDLMNKNSWRYTQTFIGQLKKQYPYLRYYNYLQDSRFSSVDFFDADHLNTAGSVKLSLIIRKEIIQKLLPY